MPFLASLVALVFGQVFELFARFITRKIAFYTAMIAVLTGLTASLYAAIALLLEVIYVSFPINPGLVYAFMPSNTILCVSTYASVALLKWAYDWNAGFIQKNLFL